MKIKELMTREVETISLAGSLAAAVEKLWRRDCGVLPVLGEHGKLAGIITDRDIAIALGTRHQLAAHLTVAEVMSPLVYTCEADDDVELALTIMKQRKVRRLPIVGPEGEVQGIISIADIARGVGERDIATGAVDDLMRIICQHPKHMTTRRDRRVAHTS